MVVIETARGPFRVVDVYYPRLEEFNGLANHLALNQIVHIRQAPALLPASRIPATYCPFETILIDLTRDLETLFSECRHNSRRQVKKTDGLRDSINVRRNDAEAYADFLLLYNAFVSLKRHSEKLSKRQIDALKPSADVLVLYFKGRPMCSHVLIRDESLKRVAVQFSASTRLTSEYRPIFIGSLNRWLHWYEIRLYKSEGMRIYDLGGAGTKTPGTKAISFFKSSFGGNRVVEHDYIMARTAGRAAVRLLYMIRRLRGMDGVQ